MRTLKTLSFDDAYLIARTILNQARSDQGAPVAISIYGADDRPIIFAAIDDVLPGSITIAPNKAHTALALRKDTIVHHQTIPPKDPSNYGDQGITMLGGGVPITVDGQIVGSVGISGRDAFRKPDSAPAMTDHELACHGRDAFLAAISATPS